jgi:mRNA interferase MazF
MRGEVWDMQLDPIVGHEQGGIRPCLVVSNNNMNQGRSELLLVIPLSKVIRQISSHIPITPPEGGVTMPSDIMCEHVRSVSTQRLVRYRGDTYQNTIRAVEPILRRLFGFNGP